MEVYFLRHAIAEDRSDSKSDDSQRPLTDEGVRKMKKGVEGMKHMEFMFNKVISSPYLRARDTANLVIEGYGFKDKIRFSDALTPSADIKNFVALLDEHAKVDQLLLVGHMPSLSHFISYLISGTEDVQVDLKKGGLCRVDVYETGPKPHAELKWLLTSKQLRELAG